MKDDFLRDHLMAKLNTRAFSMFSALILICAGAYMCFLDLQAKGSINLKATLVEGNIETGSLGLMAMFLGVLIVMALNLARPYSGQEVRIVVNGNEISAKGLSYRKLHHLLALASSATTEAGADVSVIGKGQSTAGSVNVVDVQTRSSST